MSSVLRNLYLFRVAFSAVWVALVSTAAPSAHSGDTVRILAGLLLVVYPISDAAATVVDCAPTPPRGPGSRSASTPPPAPRPPSRSPPAYR
jgi:hypothetical protein